MLCVNTAIVFLTVYSVYLIICDVSDLTTKNAEFIIIYKLLFVVRLSMSRPMIVKTML